MVAPPESKEGMDEGRAVNLEEFAKKRRKKTLAVSIQKGRLLFLPTALQKPEARPSDETKSSESEEN
jgi:hypothetical protein